MKSDTWMEPVGNGLAHYSSGSGKIEMVGYTPPSKTRFQTLVNMRRLLKTLPLTVVKSDWGNGWLLYLKTGIRWNDQWARWTLYLDQSLARFSLYNAVPDIDRGIDCEDEMEAMLDLSSAQVVQYIRAILHYEHHQGEETKVYETM